MKQQHQHQQQMIPYSNSTTMILMTRNIDDNDGTSTISSVHPDILLTHILTRIDGPTLASVSCASSQLHSLSTEQKLWSDICRSTWPSINHPRIQKLISTTFSDGPRSFFSDSFPLLIPPPSSSSSSDTIFSSHPPPELIISAVDIHYKDQLIFSKTQETETLTGWFRCSPFRIDLVDEKDVISTHIPFNNDTCRVLGEEIRLSWIVLYPTGRRAANISSGGRAVYVHQHWLTRDIEMKFVTVLSGVRGSSSTEFVQSGITVTCRRSEEGEEVHVREVSLKMEDMDGMNLSGKESLRILVKGMLFGRRMKGGKKEANERYEEYLKKKKERKERKLRRVGILDSICVYFGILILTWICVKFAINFVGQT